jgi:hypothetical protein
MKKIILFILTVGVSFLAAERVFSQEQKLDTTSSVSETSDESTYVRGITPGRARSLVGTVTGLISLIIGWRVKRSAAKPGGRSWAVAGLVLGITAMVLSVVHLANITGGFGTGGGKAGAIVAIVFGLIGTILNGLALRSKAVV